MALTITPTQASYRVGDAVTVTAPAATYGAGDVNLSITAGGDPTPLATVAAAGDGSVTFSGVVLLAPPEGTGAGRFLEAAGDGYDASDIFDLLAAEADSVAAVGMAQAFGFGFGF